MYNIHSVTASWKPLFLRTQWFFRWKFLDVTV